MKRLTLLTAIFALLLLSVPQIALADDDERGDQGDRGDHGDRRDAMRFGPYASSSPDSGTCGNDWANDTFKRVFTARKDSSGVWQLREDFKDGKFVTVAGASPGACQTSGAHGTLVTAGITGEFKGWLAGSVTGGTFNPAGGCPAPCTGDQFVLIHFGAAATWNVAPFKFTYHADGNGDDEGDGEHSDGGQHLLFRHWQNASDDQGGNRGDIATQ